MESIVACLASIMIKAIKDRGGEVDYIIIFMKESLQDVIF
jgi:hypothetical protein